MSKGKKNTKLPPTGSGGWDEALVKEVVADSDWDYCLVFVVPAHSQVDDHLHILKQAIAKGQRRKFMVFDKEILLQKAIEDSKGVSASTGRGGGGGKSKLGSAVQDRPMHGEVCEHIANAVSSGEVVPVSLLARLIKYNLIKRKKTDLSAEALNKEALAQGADTKNVKKGTAAAGKSTKKGKATPAIEEDAIPLPQKVPTTMKKRGEEENDVKFMDDEPEDGPNSYIILSGFTEAELVQELISVNVNVHCIVRLQSEICSKEVPEEANNIKAASACLLEFWSLINELFSSAKTLQNAALVDMSVPTAELPTDDTNVELYGMELFNILADKIYNLLALHTQYKHYLDLLNILNVPFVTNIQTPCDKVLEMDRREATTSDPSSGTERASIPRDLQYYNHLMSYVPEESAEVGLILYCLVEQVSLNLLVEPLACNRHDGDAKQPHKKLSNLISELALPATDKQELLTSCTSSTIAKNKTMQVLLSQDLLQQKLYHLRSPSQYDLHSSSAYVFELLWLKTLLKNIHRQVREYNIDDPCINALDNTCITQNVSLSSLRQTLNLLSLEYLHTPNASSVPNCSSTQLQNLVFDHPFSLQLKENSVCDVELFPSVFVPSESYCVQEYLDESAIVQQIQSYQLTTHPYIHCFHHKHLKSGLLITHTGYDGKPLHEYQWLAQSHFPLGFQDYILYVANNFGDAIDKAVAFEIKINGDLQLQQTEGEIQADSPSLQSARTSANNKKSTIEDNLADNLKNSSSTKPSCANQVAPNKLFNAYDLCGTPFLCKGFVRTAFTADGSQIQTKAQEFVRRPATLSTTVLDGENQISTYLVRGKKDKAQKATKVAQKIPEDDLVKVEASLPLPLSSPITQPIDNIIYCGLHAFFKDSVTVSLSHFGPDGNGELPFKPELPKILQDANSATSSRPQSQATPPPPQKLSKKQLEQQQQFLEDQKRLEEQRKKAQIEYTEKWNAVVAQCKYQQLYASNPCGLHINCQIFSDTHSDPISINVNNGYIVIRQSYQNKSSGTQSCEQVLLRAAYKEHHRCYLSNGSVICFLDQSIMIRNADGSFLRTANIHEHEQYTKLSSSHAKMKTMQPQEVSDRMKSATSAVSFASDDVPIDKSLWIVTTAGGERFIWKEQSSTNPLKVDDASIKAAENGGSHSLDDASVIKLSPIRVCRATDPITKEEIVTREDDTLILYHPDGSNISEFADGTRITTVLNNEGKATEIITECPGYATVHYKLQGSICIITFPDSSVIECNSDGSYCITKTENFILQINNGGDASYTNLKQASKQKYILSHTGTADMLQYCDSMGNNFNVDPYGKISMKNEQIVIPLHPNFSPFYYWFPENAPPYLLSEATLQESIVRAQKDTGSVVIKDTEPTGFQTSTTLIRPCLSGLQDNYQVPYLRKTLLPANLHQHGFLSKNITPCLKALQYQHFVSKVPISKTVKQEVLQGVAKYISWREKQEIASNTLLPSVNNNEEAQQMQALESKWKGTIPSSLFNETLLETYMQSMAPKPTLKSELLQIVVPKVHKRKLEKIDDVKKVLRENKHPPYFSLHTANTDRNTEVQITKLKEAEMHIATLKLPATVLAPSSSDPARDVVTISDFHESFDNSQSTIKLHTKESVTSSTAKRKTESVHTGLQVTPEEVNFDVIGGPGVYSQLVNVRNNSTKPARLKVKQSPSSTDMKIIYKPGPIAAGMSRSITIELHIPDNIYTIPNENMLEISSETGTLFVPVKTKIRHN